MIARTIQHTESRRLLRVLFDSGGSHTLIHSRCLPKGCSPIVNQTGAQSLQTIAGSFVSNRKVYVKELVLPEFDKTKRIDGIEAFVFDSPCNYDVILGRDFLSKTGIVLNFEHGRMLWFDQKVNMKSPEQMHSQLQTYLSFFETDPEDDEIESYYQHAGPLMDAKYEKTSPKAVVSRQHHLSQHQQLKLQQALEKVNTLFDGSLGHYPHRKVHLDLIDGAEPVHSKPYAIPRTHDEAFKKELQHLVEIGVLRPCGPTEWAAPTFLVPKKDGRV